MPSAAKASPERAAEPPPATPARRSAPPNQDATPAAASAADAAAPRDAEVDTRADPQRWLAEIERLRRAGKLERARSELAALVAKYPDLRLPDSLEALR